MHDKHLNSKRFIAEKDAVEKAEQIKEQLEDADRGAMNSNTSTERNKFEPYFYASESHFDRLCDVMEIGLNKLYTERNKARAKARPRNSEYRMQHDLEATNYIAQMSSLAPKPRKC